MSNDAKLPWGISSQKIQPGALKTISESKLAAFAVGQQKKTRFQKTREEKEQKLKEEEEEAAKIYDSFVASFTVEDEKKSFVRGGKLNDSSDPVPEKSREQHTFEKKHDSKGTSEMEQIMNEIKTREDKHSNPSAKSSQPAKSSSSSERLNSDNQKSGKQSHRQIDDFLNELKVKQENKSIKSNISINLKNSSNLSIIEENVVIDTDAKGFFDDGDPNTTNLHIGNLAPTVTEEHLFDLFSKYGDVNSVKVMWPRTEEEKSRKRNSGFVSFMKRQDAEDAKLDLDHYEFEGHTMIISWGKAVKLNSNPFSLPSTSVSGSLSSIPLPNSNLSGPVPPFLPPPRPSISPSLISPPLPPSILQSSVPVSNLPRPPLHSSENSNLIRKNSVEISDNKNENSINKEDAGVIDSRSKNTSLSHSITKSSKWDSVPNLRTREMNDSDPHILIKIPQDSKTCQLINTLAKFVASDGDAFEKVIRSREENNPNFKFLFDVDSSEGQYYRWRTYAYIMGDSEKRWNNKPFQITASGIFIVPPKMVSQDRSASPSPHNRSRREGTDIRRNDNDRYRRSPSSSPSRRHRKRNLSRSPSRRRNNSISNDDDDDRSNRRRRRSRSRSHSRDRDRYRDSDRAKDRYDDRKEREFDHKKYVGMTGAQIERARAKERGSKLINQTLSDDEFDEFTEILQTLTISRNDIKYAMGFAYDKVEAAEDVVNILKESLILRTTSPPLKIARLYLLSDILYNSGVPIKYASNYRVEIQSCLPQIFDDLGIYRRSLGGRLTTYQVEERMKRVLESWEESSILSSKFILGLEAAFYESESDANAYRDLMNQEAEESAKKETLTKEQEVTDEMELDQLKRQAKYYGIYVPPNITLKGLRMKFDNYNKYQSIKQRTVVGMQSKQTASIILSKNITDGQKRGDEEYDVNIATDDIDGAPIEFNVPFIHPISGLADSAVMSYGEDDVDGVPMDLTDNLEISQDRQPNTSVNVVIPDDIDGIPIDDDIDGVPIDNEVDGIPL